MIYQLPAAAPSLVSLVYIALCVVAVWAILRTELREPRAQQWLACVCVVFAMMAVQMSADIPYNNPCSEENLRLLCGDNWEWCWWAGGCWMLPG